MGRVKDYEQGMLVQEQTIELIINAIQSMNLGANLEGIMTTKERDQPDGNEMP